MEVDVDAGGILAPAAKLIYTNPPRALGDMSSSTDQILNAAKPLSAIQLTRRAIASSAFYISSVLLIRLKRGLFPTRGASISLIAFKSLIRMTLWRFLAHSNSG